MSNILANNIEIYYDLVTIVRQDSNSVFETNRQTDRAIVNREDLKDQLLNYILNVSIFSLSLTLIKSRQIDSDMDIKELLIRVTEPPKPKQEHSIIFLTFTNWPGEEKIPTNTQAFLSLIHLAHSYQTGETPLLIHCNTGVGRTGCTLLISLLIIKMIRGRSLDVFTMAKECRRQRCGFIQTEQQYRFVYECIRDALNMAIEHSIMQSAQ
jgi:protein tyrosine phosphatase